MQRDVRLALLDEPFRGLDRGQRTRLLAEARAWWKHATLLVPAFADDTTVDFPVGCTYDFDVAATKYFLALAEGDVPLEFLFSGTVFYTDDGALRTARISWESEAGFRMPVAVWKEAVESCFPGTAWLRLRRDVFDRLAAYRTAKMLPTWEAVVDDLLEPGS